MKADDAGVPGVPFRLMRGKADAFGSRIDRGWLPASVEDLEAEERTARRVAD